DYLAAALNEMRCRLRDEIAGHRQAAEALRRSEQQYRLLVETAGEAIVTVDEDGVFHFFNRTAVERMGASRDELLGKTMWDLFDKPTADRNVANIRRVLRAGRGGTFEEGMEVRGQWRWYRTSIEPIPSPPGEPGPLALVIARDVTEQKRMEDALRAAHRKLVEAREAERKRLARELHDAVGQELVALKMLIGDGDPPAAQQCARLIREVRRVCHGLYPPALDSLGLAAALRQLARSCPAAVGIELRCPPELLERRFAPAVEIALFRVAQEAVQNALKHSGAKTIELALELRDGQVHLAVRDDGCGFDPAEKAGQGLGLHTMTDRCQALGGSLRVDSSPGRTEIRAIVPASPPASAGQRAARPDGNADSGDGGGLWLSWSDSP
ncbi:MAG: PAS domain S-box protein, partial [Planctomycetes bacterium]|nr:PAS domain S-box protein [Planctomycetota bacterium]